MIILLRAKNLNRSSKSGPFTAALGTGGLWSSRTLRAPFLDFGLAFPLSLGGVLACDVLVIAITVRRSANGNTTTARPRTKERRLTVAVYAT